MDKFSQLIFIAKLFLKLIIYVYFSKSEKKIRIVNFSLTIKVNKDIFHGQKEYVNVMFV